MAKYHFTIRQFDEIKFLLKKRLSENRAEQKKSRAKIRKLGFNISDHFNGFTDQDFQRLLSNGLIKLIDSTNIISPKSNQSVISNSNSYKKISLPPIINSDTKILILGTMPGENSLIHQQYYNNKNNQFWKIIFSILNKDRYIEEYEKKIQLLKEHKIGLWDVLMTCDREGSSDSEIKNPITNDFDILFERYSKIEKILFNGKDSFYYFKNLVNTNHELKLIQLNSTSSLNTHLNFSKKVEEWRKYLTDT